MIPVDAAIHRVRRDLILSALLKGAFLLAVVAALTVGPGNARVVMLLGLVAAWWMISTRSARGSRIAAGSPALIASGQFEEAERHIEQAMQAFSVFRAVKLQALHHLALLRHAQRRWQESAALSRALLSQRLGALQPLAKPAGLILADALLEMNDLRGAYEAILRLYQQRLSLTEVLNLLTIQLDYLARIEAWPAMMEQWMAKVQLAELMPPQAAARAQATLALAALRTGRTDIADWLRGRAQLLADPQRLAAERPMLWEVWSVKREDVKREDVKT